MAVCDDREGGAQPGRGETSPAVLAISTSDGRRVDAAAAVALSGCSGALPQGGRYVDAGHVRWLSSLQGRRMVATGGRDRYTRGKQLP